MTPAVIITTPNLRSAVELYWLAMVHVRNIVEDVEGADGRLGYLHGLRYKLLVVAQEMDGLLHRPGTARASRDRLATAVENGLPGFGISADHLVRAVGLDDVEDDYEKLKLRLLAFADTLLAALPGWIPDVQGAQGQRHVLKAMQRWQAAALHSREDLGILKARLQEL